MFHASDRHGEKKEEDGLEKGKVSRYITENSVGDTR